MGHYISDAEGKLTKIAGKNYKAYMPLGMIFASAVMLEETSVKRLDGQSLSITGTYKDFCNWVIKQGANAPTCNISTYASEMTTYGQCGKFVINNTASAQTSGTYTVPAHSIKLPTITEFVASNNGGDTIGLAELDMFKSHTHYLQDYPMVTTAYSGTKGWPVSSAGGANSDGGYLLKENTFATGDEETRPKNVRYPYYIVVAQGVKPIALADMEQKADKDASNLSNANVENWQTKCGFERAEVIYDADSTDSNLNWGYRSGLPNGSEITHSIDASFKGLEYLISQDYRNSIVFLDLTKKDPASETDQYIGVNCYQAYTENGFLYLYQATCTVSGDRQRLSINLDRFQSNNWTAVVKQGVVKKIIGVK